MYISIPVYPVKKAFDAKKKLLKYSIDISFMYYVTQVGISTLLYFLSMLFYKRMFKSRCYNERFYSIYLIIYKFNLRYL